MPSRKPKTRAEVADAQDVARLDADADDAEQRHAATADREAGERAEDRAQETGLPDRLDRGRTHHEGASSSIGSCWLSQASSSPMSLTVTVVVMIVCP